MSPVLTQYVSQPITLDEQTQKMKQHLLQDIRRSAYVYRVDCGGCNACEIEIFAAITPVFDAERFGIKVVSSPRHADILLFTAADTARAVGNTNFMIGGRLIRPKCRHTHRPGDCASK